MNIIYLRKSREDINKEDSLENHRTILTNLCKNKGWEYTIFEEIGTSDSLEQRTEINKVIKLINEGKVKRVICMALDRLSRNQFDSAFIQKLLMEHNVEVITPSKNYNLNDDSDILLSSFENIISAQEYRLIKRRMAIGKEVKAKQGKITSGVPPLGYKKDKNINKVLVDEEGKKKYRFLVEKFLTGEYSTHTLAIEFNKRFVGNRGKLSNNSRIYKILTNRFYLGYVKFKGKWYEGEHEPLITLEEFKQIENLLKGKSLIKKREGYIERSFGGSAGEGIREAERSGFGEAVKLFHLSDFFLFREYGRIKGSGRKEGIRDIRSFYRRGAERGERFQGGRQSVYPFCASGAEFVSAVVHVGEKGGGVSVRGSECSADLRRGCRRVGVK